MRRLVRNADDRDAKDWLNSLRRLVLGPQSLERTLALTLGGLVLGGDTGAGDQRGRPAAQAG